MAGGVMLADLHFLRPLWLFALLLAPLAWWLRRRVASSDSAWGRVVDPSLLPHVLAADTAAAPTWRRWLLPLLLGAYVLMVTALAGPVWKRLPQPLFNDRSALVILLDLSKSMDAQDVRPSRIARARFKIADLLARRGTGMTALIVYAADAYAVVPLTDDVETIRSQLPVLETSLMPAQGSQPERAISRALSFLHDAGLSSGDLLFVTDSLTANDAAAVQSLLTGHSIRVSFLAIGTEDGAPIPTTGGGFIRGPDDKPVIAGVDTTAMRSVADATGGSVTASSVDDSDVSALTNLFTDRARFAEAQRTDRSTQRWREEGPWLLLPLLPLAAYAFRRGVLLVALATLIHWPPPAEAASWADLWATPDQRGQRAFEAGNAAGAAEQFQDPRWQSAARYRAGDFEGAVEALSGASTSDDFYNRGNALVRSGRYADAIAAYEQSLKLNPDNGDARHNRDLVRQLQQSQPQGGDGQPQSPPQQDSAKSDAQDGSPPNPQQKQPSSGSGDSSDDPGQQPNPTDDQQASKDGQSKAEQKLDELLSKREDPNSSEPDPQPSDARPEDAESEEGTADQQAPDHRREQDQADEQWLRRIPDDPGGLLRRKFYYQYSQSSQTPPSETPW
jgi:Ca-activated chloride channel family protein